MSSVVAWLKVTPAGPPANVQVVASKEEVAGQ
ncbi:MAG: hypothetical protein JWM31_2731, partial [Solirubrobacterales bacterium]|nr:hypothetical protein [Solirubrobacterales bacterium]